MGGIYINGIDFPNDCALLLKVFPDGRVGVPVHLNWCGTIVVKDAEAVPVPPHGRLIDADALCEGRVSNDNVVICAKAAPTIIPAESITAEEARNDKQGSV